MKKKTGGKEGTLIYIQKKTGRKGKRKRKISTKKGKGKKESKYIQKKIYP